MGGQVFNDFRTFEAEVGNGWDFFINDPIGTSYAKSLLHQVDAVALRASDAVAVIKFMHVFEGCSLFICQWSEVKEGCRLGGNDFLAWEQANFLEAPHEGNCAGRNMNITASGGACPCEEIIEQFEGAFGWQ